MTKKCGARLCIPGLARHFFRHSAVLLRKVPNILIFNLKNKKIYIIYQINRQEANSQFGESKNSFSL